MFKKILQFILRFKLKILSQIILWKYKPFIIGVTGSVGKTSTKEAVYCILSSHFSKERVRRNIKNYNNDIGVPLTILGLESGGHSFKEWLNIFLIALKTIFFRTEYPEILVLEMGADRPGDIKYLTRFIHSKIGIITAIGEIPVHVEFFKSPVQVAREKAVLAQSLSQDGWLILNYDDEAVRKIRGKVGVKILTYGFEEGADVRAVNFETQDILEDGGITFKIEHNGKIVPVRLKGILGRHQVYGLLAAAAVGITFEINLIEIIEALQNYKSPAGRMKLLKGIKNSWIIDDTYNSSPSAVLEALATLKEIKIKEGGKKIAVLGDMLELGQFTEKAHRMVGKRAIEIADIIFAIGTRAAFIADEARQQSFPKEKIFEFDTADEAKKAVQDIIEEGDLILIKGSQSMRMEKIVEEIMAEPQRAEELLVRQEETWKK